MYGDWISIVFRAAPIASRYSSLMLLAPDIGLLHTTIDRAPVGRGGSSGSSAGAERPPDSIQFS